MDKLLYKCEENKSRITKYDNITIFEMYIPYKGTIITSIKFNVDYLPEEKYPWFCRVVGNQILESTNALIIFERKRIQNEIKKSIGIK